MAETVTTTTAAPNGSETVTVTEKKSGWQTSEFWLTVATSLIAILNKAFDWNIPQDTILQVVGVVASYVFSRGIAKKT